MGISKINSKYFSIAKEFSLISTSIMQTIQIFINTQIMKSRAGCKFQELGFGSDTFYLGIWIPLIQK